MIDLYTEWEKLNRLNEDATFTYDEKIYGEEEELEEDLLMEMANLVGSKIKVEDVDFSIYFSRRNASRHAIRLKVFWDRNSVNDDRCGYIELHGNYDYSQDPKQKYKPKAYMVDTLRYFVKKYKIIFVAVWEGVLGEDTVQDYFREIITFKDLLSEFYENKIGKQKYEALSYANDLKQLENIVRKFDIFNMND